MGRFIDWLTDRVQAESGEKERRQLVQELKAAAYAFKETIEKAISQLNVVIEKFNAHISQPASSRKNKAKYRNTTCVPVEIWAVQGCRCLCTRKRTASG